MTRTKKKYAWTTERTYIIVYAYLRRIIVIHDTHQMDGHLCLFDVTRERDGILSVLQIETNISVNVLFNFPTIDRGNLEQMLNAFV